MHRSFALFLCIVAQGAVAQCVAPVASTTTSSHPATHAQVHATAANAQGIIKTAAAGTPDDAPPAVRESVSESPRNGGEDRPHRSGTAMLLAALAFMSGIALRRFGAGGS